MEPKPKKNKIKNISLKTNKQTNENNSEDLITTNFIDEIISSIKNKNIQNISGNLLLNNEDKNCQNTNMDLSKENDNQNNDKLDSVSETDESNFYPNKFIKKPEKKKRKFNLKWPLTVLMTTFILSLLFSFASQFILSGAGIAVSIILLIFFLSLAMISDMIGVASTSSDIEPFNSMCAKKIPGAKETRLLIKNAEKVSSIFCDIIGDICGIISGAVAATLVIQILGIGVGGIKEVIVASLISALIAALTVFLKSIGKVVAINNANNIMFTIGKIMRFLHISKK